MSIKRDYYLIVVFLLFSLDCVRIKQEHLISNMKCCKKFKQKTSSEFLKEGQTIISFLQIFQNTWK